DRRVVSNLETTLLVSVQTVPSRATCLRRSPVSPTYYLVLKDRPTRNYFLNPPTVRSQDQSRSEPSKHFQLRESGYVLAQAPGVKENPSPNGVGEQSAASDPTGSTVADSPSKRGLRGPRHAD